MVVTTIVIGVIVGFCGVYLRESVQRAYQQKIIATKLEAYLLDWIRYILESDFALIFEWGYAWQEEEAKAFIERGTEGMTQVTDRYKQKLNELKTAIGNGQEEGKQNVRDMYEKIQNMDENSFSFQLKQMENSLDDTKNSVSFISDDEAAQLSWASANNAIPMKTNIMLLLFYSIQISTIMRNSDDFKYEEVSENLYKLIESGIYVFKYYMPLLLEAQLIRNKNLLELVIKNLTI